MFGLSNFIITEFLLIFYSLVTNVLYSYNKGILLVSSCISIIILSHISSNNWCYVSRGRNIGLLHRSIRRVKSLKRTLYSLPKTILMSTYTLLHDVNVTSIYNNTRTHILIFLYKTNLPFDLWAEEGRNRCGFLPPYDT